MACLGTLASTFNSLASPVQSGFFGRQIAAAELKAPPIFIVGHWRSGTTLMHELLTLDERFAFPNNFDAFTPRHLLVTRWFLQPFIDLLLPGKRPMDGMSIAARSPQEDDFALISLGAPTMYRKIAFPNRRFDLAPGESDLEATSNVDVSNAMAYFLRVLTVSYKKPLVLKSPPHTARLANLASQFPGARFIHISRDPQQIVPSTLKLWRALDWTQGFQIPRYSDAQMIEYIHREQSWMYDNYRQQVIHIPAEQRIEVRFEDLVNDPTGVTEKIYDQFRLGDFENVSRRIRDYLVQTKNVQPSRPDVDVALQRQIKDRWGWYLENFGYG